MLRAELGWPPRSLDVDPTAPARPTSPLREPGRRLAAIVALLAFVGACSATAEPPRASDGPAPVEEAPDPESAAPPRTSDSSGSPEPTADPAGTPVPQPPPEPPESREQLRATAAGLLAGAIENAESGELAVLVTDQYGREIVAHEADRPVLPASTVKILTAAAVLSTLGPDATLSTRLETTAPVQSDGTVDGDLVLIGGGDPVLATERYGTWVYPVRPRTPLEALADGLVDAGVQRVEGELIGTADHYSGPPRAEGWPDRYFSDFDARYHAGLTVDAGLRTLVSYPEPADDDADQGAASGPALGNEVVGTPSLPDEPEVDGGDEPADDTTEDRGPPEVRVDHATEPAEHATDELLRLLEERGVEVTGGARADDVAPPTIGRLAEVTSPPMDELLRFAVQRSDNFVTDALFRVVARARTGEGSWEAGDRALRQVLERHGIDHEGAVFADGSGLSRDDRVTARLLLDVDRAMRSSRHRSTWSSLMAVMGESGTLQARMAGTPAEGRFVGKTGTLRDVTGLVGSVIGGGGQARYHLAVVANDAGASRSIARVLTDELVLLLAADVADCVVDEAEGEPSVLGRQPLAVAC